MLPPELGHDPDDRDARRPQWFAIVWGIATPLITIRALTTLGYGAERSFIGGAIAALTWAVIGGPTLVLALDRPRTRIVLATALGVFMGVYSWTAPYGLFPGGLEAMRQCVEERGVLADPGRTQVLRVAISEGEAPLEVDRSCTVEIVSHTFDDLIDCGRTCELVVRCDGASHRASTPCWHDGSDLELTAVTLGPGIWDPTTDDRVVWWAGATRDHLPWRMELVPRGG